MNLERLVVIEEELNSGILEDNIYLKKGVLAKGNQELVQKVLEKAKKLGRKLASQEETKKILGLY